MRKHICTFYNLIMRLEVKWLSVYVGGCLRMYLGVYMCLTLKESCCVVFDLIALISNDTAVFILLTVAN